MPVADAKHFHIFILLNSIIRIPVSFLLKHESPPHPPPPPGMGEIHS